MEAMATDCRGLLRTIHKQTYELRDPNVLHQLSSTLREVAAILNKEMSQTFVKANIDNDTNIPEYEFINGKSIRNSDTKDTKTNIITQ